MGKAKRSTGIARFILRAGRLPRLHRRGPLTVHSGPLQPGPERSGMLEPGGAGPRPEGWSLVAQAPGQKGAFATDSSEPRRVDTKPLTTDAPLPVWGTRQGIGLPHRGDLGLAPPGYDPPPLCGSREGL